MADLTLPGVDLREELGNLSDEVLREIGHRLRIRHYEYDKDPSHRTTSRRNHPPDDIEVQEVYRAQDEVMIECSASYDCTIDGYLFKSEAYGLSDDGIYVSDWDWNEHYVAVEFHGNIEAHFLVRIAKENENEHEEDEAEYSVQSIEGW